MESAIYNGIVHGEVDVDYEVLGAWHTSES